VTNVNLHEYKVPTIADVPSREAVILPQDERLGITPIGEGAVGTAPALANAVADALSTLAAFDLPITPQQVIAHAEQAQAEQAPAKQRS
jgi:CO/xanthine dehydrogenase Mo-binding subunit